MKHLRSLYPYARRYRHRLIGALIGTGVFTLLSVLPPLVMRYMLDRVVEVEAWHRLPWVVAVMILVPVAAHGVHYVNTQLIMLAGRRFIGDIRVALYRRVLNLSMRYHGENPAGSVVVRVMGDVNLLQKLLTSQTVTIIVDSIRVVFALVVTFSISVRLATIMCLIVVLYLLAYRKFKPVIRSATQSYRQILDQIAGRLQETVEGVRQVRIYNREDWETSQFLERTSDSLDKSLTSSMGAVNLSVSCTAISGLGSVLIGGLGATMVLQGEMSYGDLVAFLSYLGMLISPIVRLTNLAAQLTETYVSVERVAELLDERVEISSSAGALPIKTGHGDVEFRNIHFAYEPEKPLFHGLSLKVAAGTSVALVGETGCGKTSLTSLLMRYWDVQEGAVLINGQDIRTVDLASVRALFGVVLQSPVIFDATLAENIAYGKPEASREDVEAAARVAEIYELAASLPDGFDTKIGADGVKLSVGEKQRLSIARAIVRDPVILVMDEATSSLDSHSEALIQKALARVLYRRTSFVVAHRLSTIVSADVIVVMHAGAIVEKGTHLELMASNGVYRELYEELRGELRESDE